MALSPNSAPVAQNQSEFIAESRWHVYAALKSYENEHPAALPESFRRERERAYRAFAEVAS